MNDIDFLREHFGADKEGFEKALERYENGEPAAYIIGHKFFYRDEFFVKEGVLIPRPDTEFVVEGAVKLLKSMDHAPIFADLCCGSGCIGITVAKEVLRARGIMLDLSDVALEVSRRNVSALLDRDTVTVHKCNVLEGELPSGYEDKKFDMIISNPPYIPTDDIAKYPDLAPEPMMALDGGSDGMVFYRAIIEKYSKNLAKDGYFVFEIGFDQGNLIKELAKKHGFDCEVKRDYGSNDRLTILKKSKL
jgi:release factor glutamine methyltransferase